MGFTNDVTAQSRSATTTRKAPYAGRRLNRWQCRRPDLRAGDLGGVGTCRVTSCAGTAIARGQTPAGVHCHCRAPGRPEPLSMERPPRSVGPATPPSDAESPQTTTAVAAHGPERQRQTVARRSRWGPRRDRLQQWHPHGCGGMLSISGMAAFSVGSRTWRPSTRQFRTQASAARHGFAGRPRTGSLCTYAG